MQQPGKKRKAEDCPPCMPTSYLYCLQCKRRSCTSCVTGLHSFVQGSKKIPCPIIESDVSTLTLSNLVCAINDPHHDGNVYSCTSCCFSSTIPPTMESSTTKAPRCPPKPSHQFAKKVKKLSRKQALVGHRRVVNKISSVRLSSINLLDYHNEPDTFSHKDKLKRKRASAVLHHINRKRRKKPPYRHNIFEGALYLPNYNLAFQADATNNHWYCDHMALAQSPTDNSPAIIHGVFSHTSATKAYDKMLKDGIIPDRIKGERHVQVLPNCPSPEDPNKLRDVTIEVIFVDETTSVDDVSSLRG